MQSVMVDIETLGTSNDAVILSIGAVKFLSDPTLLVPDDVLPSLVEGGFYTNVDPTSQPDRKIDASTMMWWFDQSQEARAALRTPEPIGLITDLSQLTQYVRGCDEVWSHGASFDLAILRHAYEQLHLKTPWHYTDVRDTRTLFSLIGKDQRDGLWPENPHKHHALHDAAAQAIAVGRALYLIRPRRRGPLTPPPRFDAEYEALMERHKDE